MSNRLRHISLCLAAVGLMFQALVGGGAGRSLCVGCDEGGWRINEPCDSTNGKNCCDAEAEREPGPSAAVAQDSDTPQKHDCGCFDVPIPDTVLSAGMATLSHSYDELPQPPSVELCVTPIWADVDVPLVARAREGPRWPVGRSAPHARFTVLLI